MPLDSNSPLRVALFTDTFFEPNGVATLSRQFVGFAEARSLPFLVFRGSDRTRFTSEGELATQELKRGPASFRLDKDLYCDPMLTRHRQLVIQRLTEFKPDLIHVTGPGDLGVIGLWVSHHLRIPLVSSWHTNIHEYLAKRLDQALRFLPLVLRHSATNAAQRQCLRWLLRFYRTARFTLAPNQMLVDLIHGSTQRPSFLMNHGVDVRDFQPGDASRDRNKPFCIGYVGRITTEKNVRVFATIEQQLLAAGYRNFRFLIVGAGGQQKWLERHMQHAELAGVLRGDQLAAAYKRMDAFVFPSRTDTFGLVILEAMASGVPVILSPEAGERIGVEHRVAGLLANDFTAALQFLMTNGEVRSAMGSAARQFAKSRSWENVFEQLYATYLQGLTIPDLRRVQKDPLLATAG